MRRLPAVTVLLVTCAALPGGCKPQPREAPWRIPADKFLFVDHHIATEGKVIEGDYGGAQIDMPSYEFDEETKTLSGSMDFGTGPDLKVVYGVGQSLSGAAGEGVSTALFGVTRLPFTIDAAYGSPALEILEVLADGTARMKYRDEEITLKPGGTWSKTFSRVDEQAWGDRKGKARLVSRDTIVNHGILDKSGLRSW
jgi:hypothetical protein